jgi:hypothetical protein
MARQFGIITTVSGVTSVVVQSLTRTNSAEVAEARDENGYVTDLKAYSLGETLSIRGLLDASSMSITAGSKLTLNGTDYIVESAEVSETNTGFAEVNLTVRTADGAAIAAYSAPSA